MDDAGAGIERHVIAQVNGRVAVVKRVAKTKQRETLARQLAQAWCRVSL